MSDIIRFPTFGNKGRFGNQLFQYAYCRARADKMGAELQLPPWVGDALFPLATRCDITGEPATEIDSYCAEPEHLALYTREDAKGWFAISPAFRMPAIRRWYVACHLRHGDYRDTPDFWPVIEREAFKTAVVAHGYNLDNVVWVGEDRPHASTVALPKGMGFLPDWQILLDAPVLFRSNSTFSWWAATLGAHEAVYSPDIGPSTPTGPISEIPFVPGNHSQIRPKGRILRLG